MTQTAHQITPTDQIFDDADLLRDHLTGTPRAASVIGRSAKIGTARAARALNWMVQEQFAVATGNGAWRRYGKR
jgi:hypothetical protein